MTDNTTPAGMPPLPKVGPIGYASVVDIESYAKTLTIGTHLPGVRDVALWTTDQLRAYALAALSACQVDAERYQWLRTWVNRASGPVVAMNGGFCPGQDELFDQAIDSAIRAKGQAS